MYRGSITFIVRVTGGFIVSRFDFAPPGHPLVKRIELEGSTGIGLHAIVHVDTVPTREQAESVARAAVEALFEWIAYRYEIGIETATRTEAT
jgi:hypothetical protein